VRVVGQEIAQPAAQACPFGLTPAQERVAGVLGRRDDVPGEGLDRRGASRAQGPELLGQAEEGAGHHVFQVLPLPQGQRPAELAPGHGPQQRHRMDFQ